MSDVYTGKTLLSTGTDAALSIASYMDNEYPGAHLRCTVCGKIKPNDWGYLCSGWPKCCGYTMRLETKPDGEAKP